LAIKQDRNNFDEYSILNNVQFQSNADIICVQCQNRLSFVCISSKLKENDRIKVQESDRDSFGMRSELVCLQIKDNNRSVCLHKTNLRIITKAKY